MYTSPYAQAAPRVTQTSSTATISREDIEHWMIDRLSECVGLDPQDIDVALPCTAYGLDSLTGVTIVGDLEVWLNVRLSPTLLWDMPSIDCLAQYLADALPVATDGLVKESDLEQEWIAELGMNPETARQLLPQLDQLSDEDVETMLYKLAA